MGMRRRRAGQMNFPPCRLCTRSRPTVVKLSRPGGSVSNADEWEVSCRLRCRVREMATSGARLQLAIAPEGSGKATAMAALARAWTDGGGTVIGLAPQRSLRRCSEQIGSHTETLAKLTWSLTHGAILHRTRTRCERGSPRSGS